MTTQTTKEKQTILVTFEHADDNLFPGKAYAYWIDEAVEVGDPVIVHARNEYKVAYVCKHRGLTEREISKASVWVVQKIDAKAYEAKTKKEEVIQEIKNNLRKRKEEMQEILIYQQLAATDPNIKALLDELQTLDPSAVPQLTKE